VDFQEKNSFHANQDYLTFEYIGLWYTNAADVIYRYRVEGLDPDWKETRERSVTYQNIPPGSYRFVLQSSCSGNYTPANAISYEFVVRKPFYLTTVFLIIATLVVILIAYAILRARDQRVQKEASLQRRQVESQLETLKAQINPHFLFNSFNTLVSVIEEDPHAAVEYVENLSDFYRSILKYREKNLIPVQEEIEIVKNYTHILQRRYGKGLCMAVQEGLPEVWVVPMVLQILVENAVKHNVISEKKPLKVRIRMNDENSIIVENSLQRKQVTGSSTGFGLQNITSRYALLSDKQVTIGQTQDTFYVIIPVLHKDEIPDLRG
jgi:LytS/YehU family sensor histidine kinase